ncbi:hypothetical protein COO60DRAFT_1701368 [Scenedesmus sp. NREL 46B-D3]|nr:hypothetical protein COO60DRAFT_1701368 [Scenedesmus sp. NREL 46B-D3]
MLLMLQPVQEVPEEQQQQDGKPNSSSHRSSSSSSSSISVAAAAEAAAAAWATSLAAGCCEHCGAACSLSWARTGAPGCTKLTCSACTQHYQQTGKHRRLPGGLLAGMPDVLLRPPGDVLAAAAAAAAEAAGGTLLSAGGTLLSAAGHPAAAARAGSSAAAAAEDMETAQQGVLQEQQRQQQVWLQQLERRRQQQRERTQRHREKCVNAEHEVLSKANSTTSSSGGKPGKAAGSRLQSCSGSGAKPPGFKQLKRNLYVCRPRAVQDADDVHVCSCSLSNGQCCREVDRCLNRLLKVCCSLASCPAGAACQNTSLARRQLPPLQVVGMGSKGCGVVAQQDLPAGAFVAEYLGEVVSVAEGQRRLAAYTAAGLSHTYLMDLSKQEVIDATVKGGVARFINHSCEPNCETQKWQDGGELVVAIVTTTRIPAGTELTYDYRYQSHVLPRARTRCCCGAASCRGWLGSLDQQAHLQAQLEAAEQEAGRTTRRQVDARTGEEVVVDDLDPMHSEDGE